MYGARRRRRVRRTAAIIGLAVVLTAVGGWWYFRPRASHDDAGDATRAGPTETSVGPVAATIKNVADPPVQPEARPAQPEQVVLVADEQVIIPAKRDAAEQATDGAALATPRLEAAADDEPDEPRSAPGDPTAARVSSDTRTGNRTIEEARGLLEAGKLLEARRQLNSLLAGDLADAEGSEVRALLTRIADDTVFGRRSVPNDPLVDSYTIQPGDVLVNIARNFDVPYEILMVANGIADATKIRQDQKLKVPRGPFHAKISKSRFRMDVYLQDVFVRSFRVGLGTDNGTPTGLWRVKNRLENPTYYPPASATDKRILPPDHPENPLGRRWIGLEGVEGEAVGHEGFGIHGTIEPDSIGKAVSLGCIRMHNEDVAFLYMLLLPGRSTVTILP